MEGRQAININQLLNGGTVIDVDIRDESLTNDELEEEQNCMEEQLKYLNMNCLEIQDEDTYVEGLPFETIAAKMTNLDEDGIVKKRILRDGYGGDKPSENAVVRVHYNAYIEYQAEPFDSTYARRKPTQFSINNGEVIIGLDIAVQSMTVNEKSQFLIAPEYAYGVNGCLSRIPPNSTVLFEVELLAITESGAAQTYEQLPDAKQQEFEEVHKYCLALKERGKNYWTRKDYRRAIKEYNTAVNKLENANLRNYGDQEIQEELLKTLYTNLLVCYTAAEEPKKGCICFNELDKMTRFTGNTLPAKVYYNSAKCLRMLGDGQKAMERLRKALRLEPRDELIAKEMESLEKETKIHRVQERNFASRMFRPAE